METALCVAMLMPSPTEGKLVGGECVVRVNAPIFRSECWPVFYWW